MFTKESVMSWFGPSKKTTFAKKGNVTERKTYANGKLVDIRHRDNRTGESHGHVVCRGWTAPYAGRRTK